CELFLIILLTRMINDPSVFLCIYSQLPPFCFFLLSIIPSFRFWGAYSFCSCSDPEPCALKIALLYPFVFLAKDHFVPREGYIVT
ncbi:hypothetical protein VIGAN_10123500, partial [Vigna angularis var. angularis]